MAHKAKGHTNLYRFRGIVVRYSNSLASDANIKIGEHL